MSKSRNIRVRTIRRRPVDASKLGRALIELAQAQREKEAQEEHRRRAAKKKPEATEPERDGREGAA